jgi:hypothetical protein
VNLNPMRTDRPRFGMRVTVRLDPAVAEQAVRDIAAGRSASLSDWIHEAAHSKVRADVLTRLLTDLLEQTGGPLTENETDTARGRSTP